MLAAAVPDRASPPVTPRSPHPYQQLPSTSSSPSSPASAFVWPEALDATLLRAAKQAQFDFGRVCKALKTAVTRGLVRLCFRAALIIAVGWFGLVCALRCAV